MANKDPSDIIIIIRRTSDGATEVCETLPIPVANYTNVVNSVNASAMSGGDASALVAMKSVE